MQVIVRTKENAEKKLTLTYEEMEAEREEVLSSILLKFSIMYLCLIVLDRLMVMCPALVIIWLNLLSPELHASTL
jgi:hypothetical protein